ncbi:site-specific integrase [Prevotella brevis]|uniref:Site-specific integrase n=1 Tax=Xylanibacter brevis TaxID=83231 RepID=A0ABS9CEB0_9BACT|nr:site-specific integrase [Xylanibacter brevis]MCF2563323.1 site-specific integrase [Xylanibacter brevis]
MKTPMKRTVFKVILRKSEYKEQWSLIIESFPVFVPGREKPMRKHEPLGRFVTTPIWDKNSSGRTLADGKAYYRPKRDVNGIIQCRSTIDQEACIFADKVRDIRQHEYDNQSLYTETEAEQAAQNERSKCDFIKYFEDLRDKRHQNSSKSIRVNWDREAALMKMFTEGKPMIFSTIDMNLLEDYKNFLINAPQGGSKKGTITRNTASTYFSIFKAGLHQAFIDGYLTVDIAAKAKNIAYSDKQREYLTIDELNTLAATPCDRPIMKRASLFSALTGMRHSDIQKLKWKEIIKDGEHYRILFTQQKTKGVQYMPISDQAYQLCGERGEPDRLVFEGLQDPSWINKPLERWIKAAGITKHITFHCFRHTYATLQLTNGTDIYTMSKMLGHTKVTTTQIYAKIVDEKKEQAADTIVIATDFTT